MQDESFFSELRASGQMVNTTLERILASQPMPDGLRAVLRYTLEAPGKRVRSVLVLWCCELLCGSINRNAEIAAAAMEMVHTYSLIHDDLPAMDNDDMRRGRKSCHKAFDEATAILAGDALLTLAFEVLACEVDEGAIAVRLIRQLAEDAGANGMIAGQWADMEAERVAGSKELLENIHTNKTAKMFRCAAAMGGICGEGGGSELERLGAYGLKIGLGFQIADDMLDVAGASKDLGKTAGKDARAGKCTYPAVFGMEAARRCAEKLAAEAVEILEPFGAKAEKLRGLAKALLNRTC